MACDFFSCSGEAIVGQPIDSILPGISELTLQAKTISTPTTIKGHPRLLQFDCHSINDDGRILIALTTLPLQDQPSNQNGITHHWEGYFSDFAESATDWFWEMGTNLKFTYFSESASNTMGYGLEELIGKSGRDLVSAHWLKKNQKHWNKHIEVIKKHQSFQNFEYMLIAKDGSEKYIQISGKPITDDNKNFLGYRGTAHDITSITHSAQALEDSEAQLRAILESSPIGVGITFRENSIIEFANTRLAELLHINPAELVGKRSDQFWANTDERQTYIEEFDKYGRVPAHEITLKRNDDSLFWSLITWESVRIKGKTAILIWVYDIDQLKHAQEELLYSEQRFRDIAESASDWFWEMGPDLSFTFVSDRFFQVTGTYQEDILGRTRAEIAGDSQLSSDPLKWQTHLDDLEQHRAFRNFVYKIDNKQGQTRYIKLNGNPCHTPSGTFLGFRGVGTDVSAEEALLRNEARYRTMLATTTEGFVALGADYCITEVNPALCSMLGYAEHQLIGIPIQTITSRNNDHSTEAQTPWCAQKSNFSFETELIHENAEKVPVLVHSTLLHDTDQGLSSFAFISDLTDQKQIAEELKQHRDQLENLVTKRTADLEKTNQLLVSEVSERRQIAEMLEASESRLSQIVNFLPEAMFVINNHGIVIAWNQAIEKMTGVSAEAMLGKSNYEYAIPFYGERRPVMIDLLEVWNEAVAKNYHGIQQEGDTLSSETHSLPLQPKNTTYWNSARPLYDKNGKVVGAIEVIRDITKLKHAERNVLKAQQYIENIINSMPSTVIGIDEDGIVTQWNTEAENNSGVSSSDAVGLPLSQAYPKLWTGVKKFKSTIKSGHPNTERIYLNNLEGILDYLDVTVYPLIMSETRGAVIRVDNVTQKVLIEEAMVQSEKMLSVGGLAAGMAHEINNPLAGILQSMQVLKNRLKVEQKKNREVAESCGTSMEIIEQYMLDRGLMPMIESVSQAGKRAAKIVENMLSFSRKDDTAFEFIDLAKIVDDTLQLAANDYDLRKKYDFRHIEIIKEFNPDIDHVRCHPSKIQQVIFNLLRNGAHEMMHHPSTDARFILRLIPKGDMVQLEVEDNGPGMTEALRKRIFEPFFTTKGVGKGTGLGLSVSYFIITENHHGTMSVESTPGEGSKFIIQLPASAKISQHS